jgi:hypothetical protein
MTPTFNYTVAAFERDDIELVKMFLSQFKDGDSNSYKLEARPDVVERKEKAIEAIAVSENGRRLAIEHTYIQPFEGQMADNIPFLTVFEQFRTDSSLRYEHINKSIGNSRHLPFLKGSIGRMSPRK